MKLGQQASGQVGFDNVSNENNYDGLKRNSQENIGTFARIRFKKQHNK